MRVLVIGDIHGGYKALLQCLERCNFNKETDTLISLGDICDGWPDVYECVEELLSIPNLIAIKGNHDDWFLSYLVTGLHTGNWEQGAESTRESYGKRSMMIPDSHFMFFRNQLLYYKDDLNRVFVHGGFNRHLPLSEQSPRYIYYWDRDLFLQALSYKDSSGKYPFKYKDKISEVFIGHTTTTNWDKSCNPIKAANIWNLDTGGGFEGKLTIMDVNTKEYWQSDYVKDLYPNYRGRS